MALAIMIASANGCVSVRCSRELKMYFPPKRNFYCSGNGLSSAHITVLDEAYSSLGAT